MLSTQNCSGKLNNLVAPTHLELRSPVFGEFCICFFLLFFLLFLIKSLGVLCEKWITRNSEKNVQVEYASEGAKTAFTKHRWAPCQIKKLRGQKITLTKFGLLRSSKKTVFQIGDLHAVASSMASPPQQLVDCSSAGTFFGPRRFTL